MDRDRDLLPIACTLSPSDGSQRLTAWRDVLVTPGVARERLPDRVRLSFPDTAGIGNRLTELVAAERDCCAFLDWTLVLSGNRWQLDIAGTDDQLDSLPMITSGAQAAPLG
jgi:hypothetical protein